MAIFRHFPVFGRLAALAGALCAAAPAAAQAVPMAEGSPWQVSEDDFLLLELTVKTYRFNNEVRGYQTPRGVCLDLGDVIQALDLPVRLDKKSRRATGWLFSEDQKFTLDRDSNTVQNVNAYAAPLTDEIVDTPEGWCIDAKALSRWFGVTFAPDLFNMQVRLEGADDLPFLQALERRNRAARLSDRARTFDLSQYKRQDTEYRPWRTPSVDAVLRTTVRSAHGSRDSGAQGELYAAGEALGASYSARLASDQKLSPDTLRVTAFRKDPRGEMLGPLKATKVAAGDIQSEPGRLTLGSAVGRGAYIGNRPLGRDTRFSVTDLFGTLPIGWDAELYRNGQLVAYQDESSDGRYEFTDIDLYYGRNDLEVVLYGPQGQVRRESYSYPVGSSNIEPGKTYYWANVVQPDTDLIYLRGVEPAERRGWRYGVGVEHGIDRRTSFLASAQSDRLAGRRRDYLEGTLYRTFGRMQVELAGAHELGGGGILRVAAIGRLGNVNLGADFTKVAGNYISEFVTGAIDYKLGFNASTSLKMGSVALPLQAAVGRTRLSDGTQVTQVLTTAALALRGLALSASLSHGMIDDPLTSENESDTRLGLLLSTRQWGLRLRGGADFAFSGAQEGLQTVRLGAERSLGERSTLSSDLRYRVQSSETNLSVGYAHQFESFGLRARAGYTSGGIWDAGLSVNFSFGPNPLYGGIRFSEQRLARQGHAKVTVFRDDNGDGIRQVDERPLPGVTIAAGHRGTDAKTNDEGEAIVDGLLPYVPVLVGVDTGSLDDPYLVPSEKGLVIVPRPGIAAELSLAVAASGEVEGTLLSPAGTELAGITLELLGETGEVVETTISEFDGFFLFEKVPYGRYRLRVAPKTARALQMREAPGAFVEIRSGADIGRFGAIKLVDVPPVIAGAD